MTTSARSGRVGNPSVCRKSSGSNRYFSQIPYDHSGQTVVGSNSSGKEGGGKSNNRIHPTMPSSGIGHRCCCCPRPYRPCYFRQRLNSGFYGRFVGNGLFRWQTSDSGIPFRLDALVSRGRHRTHRQ